MAIVQSVATELNSELQRKTSIEWQSGGVKAGVWRFQLQRPSRLGDAPSFLVMNHIKFVTTKCSSTVLPLLFVFIISLK